MPELTVKMIEALKPGADRYEVADDRTPGLYVVVEKTGRKTFVCRYRWRGERRKRALGKVGDRTLAEARDKIRDIRRALDDKRDPEAAGGPGESADAARLMFPAVWSDFAARWTKDPATLRKYRTPAERDALPLWKARRVDAIERRDVANVLDAAEKHGKAARDNALTGLSSFFGWCLGRGLVTVNPVVGFKKTGGTRTRVLSDRELRTLWKATEGGSVFESFYRFMLAVGSVRRSEASKARWSEIDFDRKTWTRWHDRMKSRAPHVVYLSDLAISVLQSVPKTSSEWVFSTDGRRPISGFSDAKEQIEANGAADVDDWRNHDIRRTFRTYCGRVAVPDEIAVRCMAHAEKGANRHYNFYDYGVEKRQAWDRWAALLTRIVANDKAAVMAFERACRPVAVEDGVSLTPPHVV
jgi:integrase